MNLRPKTFQTGSPTTTDTLYYAEEILLPDPAEISAAFETLTFHEGSRRVPSHAGDSQ